MASFTAPIFLSPPTAQTRSYPIFNSERVLEYLASGMTEDEILVDFSELTREGIKACLSFAADRERKLFNATA